MSFCSARHYGEFQFVRFIVEDGTNLFNPSLNIRGASYSINTVWHLSVRPFDDCTRLSLSLVFVCHSFATAREGLSSHSYVSTAFDLELVDKPLLSESLEHPAEGHEYLSCILYAQKKGRHTCSEHTGLFLSSSQSIAYSGTRGARLFAALLYSGERFLQCYIHRTVCVNARI